MTGRGSVRRATGKRLEDLVQECATWYEAKGLAYLQRFEAKRIAIGNGKMIMKGRGRPDWMGAACGWGLLFETKNVSGASASFRLPQFGDSDDVKWIDGQRKQAESMVRFLKAGRGRTRAFYLLFDGTLPGGARMWMLEGLPLLQSLLDGARVTVRSKAPLLGGKDIVASTETWVHHFPSIAESPAGDLVRGLRPRWDFLSLLGAGLGDR